jgi:alpha-L-rhamnosidase
MKTPAFSQARWISRRTGDLVNWGAPVLPAPYLRKTFTWDHMGASATLRICGLGFYELYLNGRRVGDQVLDPVVSQYDKHTRYVVHDVTDYLVEGENVVGVILGNGWYNCHTPNAWHFARASWRDYPKLLLEMSSDGDVVLCSDMSWKATTGPIVFDGLRRGETYDARKDLGDWLCTDFDDSGWASAVVVAPPGGVLEEQTMPPCKVMRTLPAADQWQVPGGDTVYDIGQNMAGWARIAVSGEAGAQLTIRYGECLGEDRSVDQKRIEAHVYAPGNFQTDRYILSGEGTEVWEPRFTYHGFQYVQITIEGNAAVEKVEGRVVHTAFDKAGEFACSNEIVNRLQTCTLWSYIGNFVGIPTDCPHREKNGWTGDAQLAAETGLWNFASASSYAQWLDTIVDTQRPSGQLPGIVPTSSWGYNWGSGPAWDSVLILIPWYIHLYTGDDSVIRKHYDAMKLYVDYCTSMADDKHIVSFGLGDWCHVDRGRIVEPAMTSTAYYYMDALFVFRFAEMLGRGEDMVHYGELAAAIAKSFNERFYQGDGIYAKGEQTAMGCALYWNLVPTSEKPLVLQRLVEAIHANGDRPDFGILGAKYVPRALADNGHAELAYTLITQPEFPGWVDWLNRGANTLWESWKVASSRNHIMFGDISAWMYQYLAGIAPDTKTPGFKHMFIRPQPVGGLEWVKATHHSPHGPIQVAWEKHDGAFCLDLAIPSGTSATVSLPDGSSQDATAGNHRFDVTL